MLLPSGILISGEFFLTFICLTCTCYMILEFFMSAQLTLIRTTSLTSNAPTLVEDGATSVEQPSFGLVPSKDGLEDLEKQHDLTKNVPTMNGLQQLRGSQHLGTAGLARPLKVLVQPSYTIIREMHTTATRAYEAAGVLESGPTTLLADRAASRLFYAKIAGGLAGCCVGLAGEGLAYWGLFSALGDHVALVISGAAMAPVVTAGAVFGGLTAGSKLASYIAAKGDKPAAS
jgi:hypothetical protein